MTTLRFALGGAGDECLGVIGGAGGFPGCMPGWLVGGPGEGDPPRPGDEEFGYPLLISNIPPGG